MATSIRNMSLTVFEAVYVLKNQNYTVINQYTINRFYSFLLSEDLIYVHVDYLNDLLIRYIKFHKSKNFIEIPFLKVIKDVKTILGVFQKLYKNRNLNFDVSLQNIHFWLEL